MSTTYTVTLRFQFSAWDEADGIEFPNVAAMSKRDAISRARRMADRDGHLGSGKGRATFTAVADEQVIG